MTDIAILTRAEEVALVDCEERIERGLKTFVEVGQSLAAIRDSRLYRGTHETFESYCQERWSFSRVRAHQLATAADLALTMVNAGLPEPDNERQVRELAKVPEPDREDVWRETVERTDGKPTAAAVRETADERQKQADARRDARALLRRIVELAWSPNWPAGHVEHWAKTLGPYDEELSELTDRALKAISVLDQLVEGTEQ
jgi:hypothetical protein